MSLINLADAKVVYEDQTLPVINLISRLQVQLQEASTHIAAMVSAMFVYETIKFQEGLIGYEDHGCV